MPYQSRRLLTKDRRESVTSWETEKLMTCLRWIDISKCKRFINFLVGISGKVSKEWTPLIHLSHYLRRKYSVLIRGSITSQLLKIEVWGWKSIRVTTSLSSIGGLWRMSKNFRRKSMILEPIVRLNFSITATKLDTPSINYFTEKKNRMSGRLRVKNKSKQKFKIYLTKNCKNLCWPSSGPCSEE